MSYTKYFLHTIGDLRQQLMPSVEQSRPLCARNFCFFAESLLDDLIGRLLNVTTRHRLAQLEGSLDPHLQLILLRLVEYRFASNQFTLIYVFGKAPKLAARDVVFERCFSQR